MASSTEARVKLEGLRRAIFSQAVFRRGNEPRDGKRVIRSGVKGGPVARRPEAMAGVTRRDL